MIKTLLIILLLLTSFYFGCSYYRLRDSHPYFPTSQLPVSDTPQIIRYVDSQGVEHAVTKEQLFDVTRREAIKQVVGLKPYIDSTAIALAIKAKQIESITTISSRTQAKNLELETIIDSLKHTRYVYRDKYLDLSVTAPSDSSEQAKLDFAYNADLKLYQYWKRKHILGMAIGNKESYMDISSADPRTTIMGVRKLTVKQQTPQFGLRGQVRTSYTPSTGTFSMGPALRLDIHNVSIGVTGYYNFQDRQWRPNITTDLTVF